MYDIVKQLTPKRKEDGGIDNRYTAEVKRLVEKAGHQVIKGLNELEAKTNELEARFGYCGLGLCLAFFETGEGREDWISKGLRSGLKLLLQEKGFKPSKISMLLGAAELQDRLRKEALHGDCDFSDQTEEDSKRQLKWVRTLPISSQYILYRMSCEGYSKAYVQLSQWGEKEVSRRELEDLLSRYPKDRFERRGGRRGTCAGVSIETDEQLIDLVQTKISYYRQQGDDTFENELRGLLDMDRKLEVPEPLKEFSRYHQLLLPI